MPSTITSHKDDVPPVLLISTGRRRLIELVRVAFFVVVVSFMVFRE